MNQKILLFGSLRSSYIIQYIEEVLIPLGFDIYMQIPKSDKIDYEHFIIQHKIHIILLHEKKDFFLYLIPFFGSKLLGVVNYFYLMKSSPFNIIHIQYVNLGELKLSCLVKKKGTKKIASFWGSDLLRKNKSYLMKERRYLRKLDYISADSYLMQQPYDYVFSNIRNKLNVIYFGISLLEVIDKYSLNIDECKKYFNFPMNKKIIAIGYNATKEQQHDKVLDILCNLKNKDDYCLVFQLTYGHITDEQYIPNLISKIVNCGFEHKILQDYFSVDELAKLRIAVDVFINAQTTDAFCNSIKEYLYSKTQVINASWLHYPEIDMFPLYMNEFSNFKEIPELLEKPIEAEKLDWNKKKIRKESTWEACRNKWAEIYGVNAANDSLSNG